MKKYDYNDQMAKFKSLLLCPPTFYDIRYEINPWMNTDNPIDKAKAHEQYETLKYAYDALNVTYHELSPNNHFPDQIFTTDTGHIENNMFIKAQFKYKERRGEVAAVETFLNDIGEYRMIDLPEEIFFEGGDLIKFDDMYFFGWGKRSSKEALPILQKHLDAEVVGIELIDDWYYHLDTCFAPINKNVALANLNAFSEESAREIKKYFGQIIQTSEADNKMFACNMVTIDGKAILTQGISDELKDQLRPHVDLISTVAMSEYIKGGGSVHCASLEIFD